MSKKCWYISKIRDGRGENINFIYFRPNVRPALSHESTCKKKKNTTMLININHQKCQQFFIIIIASIKDEQRVTNTMLKKEML